VLLGALVAGLLATVVPAGGAARRSPVESLTHE
jgi:putative ABC transport system permease protein